MGLHTKCVTLLFYRVIDKSVFHPKSEKHDQLVNLCDRRYTRTMVLKNISISDKDLVTILQQYFVLRLFVFGSILTEHFSDNSDIDLLVEFDKNTSIGLFEIMELKKELQLLFGRTVDLVEKEGLKNPYRREEILRTSQQIYGK